MSGPGGDQDGRQEPEFPSLSDPHPGPWTVGEWVRMRHDYGDGRRVELIEGSLLVTPSRSTRHQRAVNLICTALDTVLPPGQLAVPGTGVTFRDGRSAVIPDVTVFDRAAVDGDLREDRIPDMTGVRLIVEVTEEDTRAVDRDLKPWLYALAGVTWYWHVNLPRSPSSGTRFPTLISYLISGGKDPYWRQGTRYLTVPVTLPDPYPAPLDLTSLWA